MSFELTQYEHSVKDYVLSGAVIVSFLGALVSAIWTWRTNRGLEKFKSSLSLEVQRELQTRSAMLNVVAGIEARFHEQDLKALQECQKVVTQFCVQCNELVWLIAHADLDHKRRDETWLQVRKTYDYMRPQLALAPAGRREELEEAVHSVYTLTEFEMERWTSSIRAGLMPPDSRYQEGEDAFKVQRTNALRELDAWSKELRTYRLNMIPKLAKQLAEGGELQPATFEKVAADAGALGAGTPKGLDHT